MRVWRLLQGGKGLVLRLEDRELGKDLDLGGHGVISRHRGAVRRRVVYEKEASWIGRVDKD